MDPKSREELIREEDAIDLGKAVALPPEIQQIFDSGIDAISTGVAVHEYDLSTLTETRDVSELLWDLFENPDNPAVAYLRKGDALPEAIREYEDSGYLRVAQQDHYYKRTARPGDWYRLPSHYRPAPDEPDPSWPAAIRKVVRKSDHYSRISFELTTKATRSAERALLRSHIQEANRPPLIEAKPGAFGFSVNLAALRRFWPSLRARLSGALRWKQ